MKQILGVLTIATLTLAISCRKKDDPAKPYVNLKFMNMVGTVPLDLGRGTYVNEHGDSFTVNNYIYYITNISLSTADGKEYKEPESYHLVSELKPESKTLTISDLPPGDYTSIKFLIGVDEARNTEGAQTGALDPVNGMYWGWHSGYIMAKVEGTSPAAPQNTISFHMGGYTGRYQTQRWVTLSLPSTAVVAADKGPVINIKSDVLEWFKTPTTINFATLSEVANSGNEAATLADNYADMFSIDHVDN